MKKGKVLVLLLTVALTMTTVPSAYAADFADDVVADTVETEDTELPAETSEEVFPEISEEKHSEDQEDEIAVQSDETSAETDVSGLDFTDEETDAAGESDTKVSLDADGGEVSGKTVPSVSSPLCYTMTLETGGCLALKGTRESENFKCSILSADTGKEITSFNVSPYTQNGSFEYDFELAQGDYIVEISTANEITGGAFTLKTSFSKTAELSFPENSNDELFYANEIDFEKVIRGHLAINNTNDYYKIEVPFEKEYVFITNKADKKNFTQILYDESGKQVAKYTTTGSREYKIKLNKGIYYYRITNDGHSGDLGTYSIKVTGHVHSYKTTKRVLATPGRQGSIVRKCSSCGRTDTTIIYMPKTVRLTARSFVYNGKSQKPGVTVIASNGKALSPKSYTVTYSENTVSAGRHDIKVTLKGRYSGVLNACYVINPKKTYIDSATALSKGIRLQIRQQPKKNATGYQLQYSLKSDFSNAKTANVSSTSLRITGLKSKTYYYVRVRVFKKSTKTYYSSWSTVRKIKTK